MLESNSGFVSLHRIHVGGLQNTGGWAGDKLSWPAKPYLARLLKDYLSATLPCSERLRQHPDEPRTGPVQSHCKFAF